MGRNNGFLKISNLWLRLQHNDETNFILVVSIFWGFVILSNKAEKLLILETGEYIEVCIQSRGA